MSRRTLILLRHGKAGYPPDTADQERPLADRGRREAALAGEWMSEAGLRPDAVLCSSARRTRETLERTGITAPVTYLDDLYAATAEQVCETIRLYAPDDATTVLVVGHAPGMPDTALTLDPHGVIERFPTSAYAVLTLGAPWRETGLAPDVDAHLTGVSVPRVD